MENIQDRLEKWAERAYNFYAYNAKMLDADYYTQSCLNVLKDEIPVELMIIGINPGYGGAFVENRFTTSKDILKGNCDINNRHYNISNWPILIGIKRILGKDYETILSDERRYVLTNATFFTTKDESGLKSSPKLKEAQMASIQYTVELIKLISPKRILCLGGKNCADVLSIVSTPILPQIPIILGFDNKTFGIPTYCIKHTSGTRWANEEYDIVGKALIECFKHDEKILDYSQIAATLTHDISIYKQRHEERMNRKGEAYLRWNYVHRCLSNYCEYDLNLDLEKRENDWDKYTISETGTKIQIVSQKGKQHIAVHFANENLRNTFLSNNTFGSFKKDGNIVSYIPFTSISKSTDEIIIKGKEIISEIIKYEQNSLC